MKRIALIYILFAASSAGVALAQGQDSLRSERDYMVIAQMLSGTYVNANQAYFEGRTGVEESLHHESLRAVFERDAKDAANFVLSVFEKSAPEAASTHRVRLQVDRSLDQVQMTLRDTDSDKRCSYVWQREAMQFRARAQANCDAGAPTEFVLSKQQLWMRLDGDTKAPYKLHRARSVECYADMPGVGGGRDEPYERYDKIELHDQGDAYWFDTRETPSRRLGVSLFLVDWPINNYHGVFSRDSLVIYVSEEIDGETKEHGYSFTEAHASRVGINLKWILASCFLESNTQTKPSM